MCCSVMMHCVKHVTVPDHRGLETKFCNFCIERPGGVDGNISQPQTPVSGRCPTWEERRFKPCPGLLPGPTDMVGQPSPRPMLAFMPYSCRNTMEPMRGALAITNTAAVTALAVSYDSRMPAEALHQDVQPSSAHAHPYNPIQSNPTPAHPIPAPWHPTPAHLGFQHQPSYSAIPCHSIL